MVEVVEQSVYVLESWRRADYDHHLDALCIAPPWAEAEHGAGLWIGIDYELFDFRDPDNRRVGAQLVGRIDDATILTGSVNGGSFGPDVDVDRVRPVHYP